MPDRVADGHQGVVRWSRARRTAIVVVDTALAVGAGALAGVAAPAVASAAPGQGPAPSAAWTAGRAPLPGGPDAPAPDANVQLVAESCSSALACVAVGTYTDVVGQDRGLLETRRGGSWSATEPPLPLDATQDSPSYLDSVSCPTDGWCEAVGVYQDVSRGTDVVIDSLSGGRWSALQAPLPADAAKGTEADAFLKSIDCNGVGSCTAVGSYKQSTGGTAGFIDTLISGQWWSETAPEPEGAEAKQDVHLMQVSCPSVGVCAASGFYTDASGEDRALLLNQTGYLTWAGQDAPLPAGAAPGTGETSESFGVSCSGAVCEAVGSYADGSGTRRGLLEHWDGAAWSATEAPVPDDGGATGHSASLSAVSCTFDGCVGVGDYEDASAGLRPLIDTVLTSGLATTTEGPQPADRAASSDASLVAVSCVSLSECTAVGSYRTANGPGGPVALTDMVSSDAAWNDVDSPVPPGAAAGAAARSTLAAVSCAASGACGAAGDYAGRHAQSGLLQQYTPPEGYWTDASDGGVFAFGRARFHGSSGNAALNQDVVGMAATPGGGGYWEVAKDGGVFAFGDARFHGSATGAHAAPVVGIVATPSGNGYWLVAADGAVFGFGDALNFGSPSGLLAHPITGMAATRDGRGYWLVASDGGVFAYGDAVFYGSPSGTQLNAPILGIAADPTGNGYWVAAADGGVFAYGAARYHGAANGLTMNQPIIGVMPSLDGGGYWLIASNGGIFAFGDATFLGSSGGGALNAPTVGGAPA